MTSSAGPDLLVTLPSGRRVALDDRGDPGGVPVVYVHGTPDSRLARHPDDGLARSCGVRLLAMDRPGIGDSDPDPAATPISVADDVAAVLDHLDVARAAIMAWSAGSLFALALAGRHPGRVRRVVLAAPLVPVEAYADDPDVLDGAGDGRRLFADMHGGMSPDEVGAELAPWLVPMPIDDTLAAELLTDTLAATDHIAGARSQLIAALVAGARQGLTGVARDIAAQATPLGGLLAAITAPVSIHVGSRDVVCPPGMARWLTARTGAVLHVHDGAGHELAITRWADLLAEAAAG